MYKDLSSSLNPQPKLTYVNSLAIGRQTGTLYYRVAVVSGHAPPQFPPSTISYPSIHKVTFHPARPNPNPPHF